MIYVNEDVEDGSYMLNLQFASFLTDQMTLVRVNQYYLRLKILISNLKIQQSKSLILNHKFKKMNIQQLYEFCQSKKA